MKLHLSVAGSIFVCSMASVTTNSMAEDAGPFILRELAVHYETAVKQFGVIVGATRGIRPADEHVVDQLKRESARLSSATRNRRFLNKIYYQWKKTQRMQLAVEERIFGTYTPNHDLILLWDNVNYQAAIFAEEFLFYVENPRHERSVRKLKDRNSARTRLQRHADSTPNSDTAASQARGMEDQTPRQPQSL